MSRLSMLCGDDLFGPAVKSQLCRGGFDFTVVFEASILSIGPATIFLLAIPLRVLYLYRKPIRARQTWLYGLKLASIAILAALQSVLLVAWSTVDGGTFITSRVSIASCVLELCSALGLALLSHYEHKKSARPSFIITVYLFTSCIFDIARARTQWLVGSKHNIAEILTTIIVVKLAMLVLEDCNKRRLLISMYGDVASESGSGIFNRSLFLWINPLLLQGFKKVLSFNDLFPIHGSLSSVKIFEQLERKWMKSDQSHRHSLLWTVAVTFKWSFLGIIFPRVCLVGIKAVQPFLIQASVEFVDSNPSRDPKIGYGLVGAYTIVYIGIAIFTGWYQHLTYRFVTMVRGGLIAMIYQRMIKLKNNQVNVSAALTLMGTDVERIAEALEFIGDVWADTIQVFIAIWILEDQLGAVCAMPVFIAIVAAISSLKLGTYVTGRQKIWFEAIQERINTTSHIIGSMTSVKMLGLTDKILTTIQSMRVKELDLSKQYRKLSTTNTCLMNVPIIMTPLFTFAIFSVSGAKYGGSLDVSRVFTSLATLSLLSYPMASVISAIPQIYSTIGCFRRIQDFLQESSRKDSREVNTGLITDHSQESGGIALLPYSSSRGKTPNDDSTSFAVRISQGSFGWADVPSIIKNIDLQLPQSALTIIVGPSGCGKSTLLKAILGETFLSNGFMQVQSTEIAFCDQSPWITSGTFRDIIIGQSEYDDTWYRSVIDACSLVKDFQEMSRGDRTEVGSNGIKLSGGQKQRLSIARAVYARKRIAIFDDILSGLDPVTEELVLAKVFSERGILRKNMTTTILVTHNFLTDAKFTDAKFTDAKFTDAKSTKQEGQDKFTGHSETNTEPTPQPIQSVAITSNKNRQIGDFSIYKYYLGSMGWWSFGIFFCFITLNATFSALQYLWVNWWSAAQVVDSNSRLGYWLGIYASFALLQSLAMIFAIIYLFIVIVPKSAGVLHHALLKAVMMAPMSIVSAIETGTLVNRFSQDMRLIDMTLPGALVNTSFQFANCVSGAILTIIAVKYTAVCLPIIAGSLYLIQKFYLRTSRQLRLLDIEAKAPLYSHFIETVSGLVTIRAFGWSEIFLQRNLQFLDESQKPFYLLFCIQRWLGLVLDLLVAGLAILLISLAVGLRGNTNAGFLGIALVNIMNLGQYLTDLIKFWTSLETSLGAILRVKTFVEETPEETLSGNIYTPNEEWPSYGDLNYKDVSASYTQNAADVITDITFAITQGQKLAVCGRTGSGKSTLISTLFGMTTITRGNITVDGIDISTLPRHIVRSRLICLPQEPFLFSGSVRLNADPWGEATDGSIIASLEKVQLSGIIAAKGGLDAQLDSKWLSHGQRQLFCLARAMLCKSTILVLDEPTSSLDTETDKIFQKLLRDEFISHTVLMVAHRLESILDFDAVIVMDRGRIVEIGKPSALLSLPSVFGAMWNARDSG